ncbi:phage tail assembly chaperone [Erythrobacter sp.]|uniref:phage tail assembly chaperone n=1 Tax=Erythrobacter sp. TaxID=1042 RepID=UPI001425E1E6|nr:phage tail assembly chaperone [Erythrobacter sp.]QIQ87698.1 MAG: phage tail assembly chaperone [Erythrobacter sp.]
MSGSFGEAAARCSSVAAQSLGWSPGEFWASTPRELAAALHIPHGIGQAEAPSREQIRQMMERDRDG